MEHGPWSCLTVERDGPVVQLRLTRPALHNRFDEAQHREFPEALAAIAGMEGVAALLISADGASFSAGGDTEMMLRANDAAALRERLREEALAIVYGLLDLPFPVIAAVQGAAIGLGATLLGCCDIVVAARAARIADPHVQLGLVAGDGGVLAWTQSVGLLRAKRYLLTGDALGAEQAFAMGLVSDLVDQPEEALPTAMALAQRIAALPRGGVRGTKQAFARLSRDLFGAAFERSLDAEMEKLAGMEIRARLEALQNRRRG